MNVKKSLNAFFASSLQWNVLKDIKILEKVERDQGNIADVAKFHIPSWWASATSSWQHVAEHFHQLELNLIG